MANISLQIIKVARPVHWVKNFALLAALIFSGHLFEINSWVLIFWAFISFSCATSSTYIFNDLMDQESDRLHPIKKLRPIASRSLPVGLASLESVVLLLLSLYIAQKLGGLFFILISSYLIIQFFYSLILKHMIILDILVIATGFVIRVYAGAVVVNAHLSVWFLLCVVSVALFLASGKRRAELNIIEKDRMITRKSLIRYKRELLNSYVTMFANAAWMSWALFTFFESPQATIPVWLFLAEISKATSINKLLMITIPISIFGIMRYQSLIYEEKSEAPEKLFLTDVPLITSFSAWVIIVIWVLYSGVTNYTF